MILFRVFPWDPVAAVTESGGALFVVDSSRNRISNVELYKAMYLAAQPEAAIAETLGHLIAWRSATFVHRIGALALASYAISDAARILSLDDVDALNAIGVRQPSRIVTRNRSVTQAWARTVYEKGGYVGVSWWSYYNPDWTSYGLWDTSSLRLVRAPQPLSLGSPDVIAAAAAISKQRIGEKRTPSRCG